MTKILMKGNHAIAEAAIRAGCQCYFGYPITPQSEIGEYLSGKLPELGRVFIPAESEIAAINMVLGAGATGVKAMTSSSSCGIALKQEGISFMAGGEVPGVIVNISRAGPGLGNITPAQGDYFQTVKGGGNGDYKVIVLAPSTVQEMVGCTYRAFYLSQKYRTPVIILADGTLGQMMEPVEFNDYPYPEIPTYGWAITGAKDREPRRIGSLDIGEGVLTKRVYRLFKKYELIAQNETSYEDYYLNDAELVITAFGSVARMAKAAIKKAREEGIKVGLLRPITLLPFPDEAINQAADTAHTFLDIEMNMGQMVQDVKIAVNGKANVKFLGKPGGAVFSVDEIYEKIKETVLHKKEALK
jgi:2-oxoglutarate/2-oxoacid ferredoxin oxidoreductase subunit alpha